MLFSVENGWFQERLNSARQKLGKIDSLERDSERTGSTSGRLNSLEKKLGKKEKCMKEGIAQLPKEAR
jgi:hypothetical protein